jgi:predicted transcriptional regulator
MAMARRIVRGSVLYYPGANPVLLDAEAPVKTIAVKVPEDLLARLDAVSKRRSVGRSSLVRKALQRFIEAEAENSAAGSFAEQTAGLAGSFKGPRDLSYARRHMKGYGQ